MPETIKFYSTKDAYGCFSNFAACPIMQVRDEIRKNISHE